MTAMRDPHELTKIEREFALAPGAQSVFSKDFSPYLGLPNLTLRFRYGWAHNPTPS